MTRYFLSGVIRSHLRGGLSLFCALAIAVVSTFHVCGWAAAGGAHGEAGVYAASVEAPLGDSDVAQEKCHICSVVSIAADAGVDAMKQARDVVPAGRVVRLFSLQPQSIVPPPRA